MGADAEGWARALSAKRMTAEERVRGAVAVAKSQQERSVEVEKELAESVRYAIKVGVPILTLANALGVSRSRIRRLAR